MEFRSPACSQWWVVTLLSDSHSAPRTLIRLFRLGRGPGPHLRQLWDLDPHDGTDVLVL